MRAMRYYRRITFLDYYDDFFSGREVGAEHVPANEVSPDGQERKWYEVLPIPPPRMRGKNRSRAGPIELAPAPVRSSSRSGSEASRAVRSIESQELREETERLRVRQENEQRRAATMAKNRACGGRRRSEARLRNLVVCLALERVSRGEEKVGAGID